MLSPCSKEKKKVEVIGRLFCVSAYEQLQIMSNWDNNRNEEGVVDVVVSVSRGCMICTSELSSGLICWLGFKQSGASLFRGRLSVPIRTRQGLLCNNLCAKNKSMLHNL